MRPPLSVSSKVAWLDRHKSPLEIMISLNGDWTGDPQRKCQEVRGGRTEQDPTLMAIRTCTYSLPNIAPNLISVQSLRIFTTTLIASSTRSRAYRNAVGSSPSGNVWVWISFASNLRCPIRAAARWVALLPSPRIPKT